MNTEELLKLLDVLLPAAIGVMAQIRAQSGMTDEEMVAHTKQLNAENAARIKAILER